jgi:hypothetical protein
MNSKGIMKLLAVFLPRVLHQKSAVNEQLFPDENSGGFTFYSSFFILLKIEVRLRPLWFQKTI